MAGTLLGNTVVVVSPRQISSNLAGEEVILQLESGVYYGLDAVGAFIWSQVQQPCTLDAICAAVCAAYDVDPAQCAVDTRQFLTGLLDAQLIEVTDVPNEMAPTAR